MFLHHRNGSRLPVCCVRVTPIHDDSGELVGAVESLSDSTGKMAALERIEHLMAENLHDPLANIGSHRYCEITLRSRFDEMRRYGWHFGVMFRDISVTATLALTNDTTESLLTRADMLLYQGKGNRRQSSRARRPAAGLPRDWELHLSHPAAALA